MYQQKTKGWYKHLDFIIFDIICLELSFLIAYIIRHGMGNPYHSQLYRTAAVMLGVMDFVLLFVCNTFAGVLKRGLFQELCQTIKQGVYVFLVFALYLFAVQNGQDFSRIVMFISAGLYIVISYLVRIIMKQFIKTVKLSSDKPAMLIVSSSDKIYEVMQSLDNIWFHNYAIRGIIVLDKNMIGRSIMGVPVVASECSAVEYVCKNWVDEILIINSPKYEIGRRWTEQFVDMGVVVHEKLYKNEELFINRQIIERIGGYTVMTTTLNYASTSHLFIKRLLDICGGLIGCVITGILFVCLAPFIYIKSPGPIFFRTRASG